jgi:hypothetical protein
MKVEAARSSSPPRRERQELTKGRVNLGLGTQVKGHNERRFSSGTWAPPAPRVEEYVRMVRAVRRDAACRALLTALTE